MLIDNIQPDGNPFCIPENLGILPPLWLQARLTLSLIAIQEKFARVLLSVAGELWLRGQGAKEVEDVLNQTARALTIRLAEKLAQAMSSLMRLAVSMVTPELNAFCMPLTGFGPSCLNSLAQPARAESESSAEWPCESLSHRSTASAHYWVSGPYEWRLCPLGMVSG